MYVCVLYVCVRTCVCVWLCMHVPVCVSVVRTCARTHTHYNYMHMCAIVCFIHVRMYM